MRASSFPHAEEEGQHSEHVPLTIYRRDEFKGHFYCSLFLIVFKRTVCFCLIRSILKLTTTTQQSQPLLRAKESVYSPLALMMLRELAYIRENPEPKLSVWMELEKNTSSDVNHSNQ